jgi:hypothetical protein
VLTNLLGDYKGAWRLIALAAPEDMAFPAAVETNDPKAVITQLSTEVA